MPNTIVSDVTQQLTGFGFMSEARGHCQAYELPVDDYSTIEPKRNSKGRHVVGVSGGKDSVALALRLAEVEPETDWEYLITPTGDELPEMVEHWENLERILGKKFIRVTNHNINLNGLIDIQKALPNFRQRWCTRILKIEPTIAWCVRNKPVIMHVGLRADERPPTLSLRCLMGTSCFVVLWVWTSD